MDGGDNELDLVSERFPSCEEAAVAAESANLSVEVEIGFNGYNRADRRGRLDNSTQVIHPRPNVIWNVSGPTIDS
jgi:hypothetical protein